MNLEEARRRYNDLIRDGATHPDPGVEAAWKALVNAIVWQHLSALNRQQITVNAVAGPQTATPRGVR